MIVSAGRMEDSDSTVVCDEFISKIENIKGDGQKIRFLLTNSRKKITDFSSDEQKTSLFLKIPKKIMNFSCDGQKTKKNSNFSNNLFFQN